MAKQKILLHFIKIIYGKFKKNSYYGTLCQMFYNKSLCGPFLLDNNFYLLIFYIFAATYLLKIQYLKKYFSYYCDVPATNQAASGDHDMLEPVTLSFLYTLLLLFHLLPLQFESVPPSSHLVRSAETERH